MQPVFYSLLPLLASATYLPRAKSICTEVDLFIHATAQNWDLPPYPNETDVSTLVHYLTETIPQSNFTKKPKKTVTGTFKIGATYCEPAKRVTGRENIIQLLLHGFGYTKTYWHGLNYQSADFEGEYSWVDHATSLGYATLSIDNLGTGDSDRPDPINTVQFPLQSQIILDIIHALRAGNCSNSIPRKFDKVVMVAHSYGSLHGRELAIAHPTDGADAYILTATAANLVGIQTIVRTATAGSVRAYDPENFGSLPPAYMTFRTSSLKDVLYSLDGEFDPELLKHDMESPAHTFAVGELASPKQNVTSNFTGPVLVLTGRIDPIVCDVKGNNTAQPADCGVGKKSIPGQTAEFFPNAKFEVYVPDKTGHNLNLGYSAPEIFGAAHGFLESKGF